MDVDIVSLKDIEELYGSTIKTAVDLNGSTTYDLGKSLLDDDIIVEIVNTLGPYSTVKLQGGNHKLIVPSDKITRKDVTLGIDRYKEVLDRYYPNRWFTEHSWVYLHYPELEITNNLKQKHTVYDLVVKFYVDPAGRLSYLYGKRYSFSAAELLAGYSHSHLQMFSVDNDEESDGSQFTSFCVGGGSTFEKLFKSMYKINTTKEFELFLIQLEEYLRWESLEGTPYICMVDIGSYKSDGYTTNERELIDDYLIQASKFMLKILSETEGVECVLVTIGDYSCIVDPSLKHEWFYKNIERKFIETYPSINDLELKGWDNRKCCYQTIISETTDKSSLPYLPDEEEEMIEYFDINRRIIESVIIQDELEKRVAKDDMTRIIQTINAWMLQGISKLNTINE